LSFDCTRVKVAAFAPWQSSSTTHAPSHGPASCPSTLQHLVLSAMEETEPVIEASGSTQACALDWSHPHVPSGPSAAGAGDGDGDGDGERE